MVVFSVGILLQLVGVIHSVQWTPELEDETNPTGLLAPAGRSFKAVNNKTISLWGGRIVLAVENKNEGKFKKMDKKIKLCISSDKKIGVCTRLVHCPNFSISQLHNNICFMDIFIPGVCCVSESKYEQDIAPISSPDIESTIMKKKRPFISSGNKYNNRKKNELDAEILDLGYTNCGVATRFTSRIVHGDVSNPARWPWMAAIFTNTILGRNFHCGGSLISSRHILTGTHCIKDHRGNTLKPNQITIRLGDSDITSQNDKDWFETGRFYRVAKIVPHPKFRNINHYFMNDVAVLRLEHKVSFSDYMSPICLPDLTAVDELLDKYQGQFATVIGFGRTENGKQSKILLEAKVPIWNNSECDDSYFAPITDIFICAGYKRGGVDACQGDSGGPLQLEINNQWIQIGITSFGKGCGEPGFPGVYARIGKFIGWIKDNMI